MHQCACGKEGEGKYCASPCLRMIQIVLLMLILIGLGLIATQRLWVPRIVDFIMRMDGSDRITVVPVPVKTAPATDDRVHVFAPLPKTVVSSPVEIRGEARGTWYFEGSFSVVLKDENGQVLGRGIAQATGEWMTMEFVPFRAMINFTPSGTAIGSLVLSKDNPSGLPANAAEVVMPVRFR